jgi:glycosyltransferase involved in cell wall biosynthesis
MLRSFKYHQTSPKMVHVLFVSLEGRIGGAETSLLLLVKCLRRDFHITVACPAKNDLANRLAEMQITSLNLPEPPGLSHLSSTWLVYFIKASFELAKIICKVRPTIVHANSFFAAMVSTLPTLLTGRRLIWHARDLGRSRLALGVCSLFCKRIIAVSGTVKDSLIRQGVEPVKIDIVHNGIEVDNCQPGIRTRPNGDTVTFANIGQFVPWKRQNLFIEAACRFIQKGGQAEFVLIGDDIFGRDCKYKAELLDKIRKCQIAKRITYLGWQDNIDKVWGQIDCLVHTANREPFGRVIIEAMAHKIPVIAPDNCGPAEIIQDGKTGILVKSGDIEQLTDAMLKVAGSKGFAMRLASAGYRQVTSHFLAERTADRIRKIYEQVLAA